MFKFREACQIGVRQGRLVFWYLLCLFLPAEKTGIRTKRKRGPPLLSPPIYRFLSSQKAFFMLIELEEQPCAYGAVWLHACELCVCLWVRTITSNMFIQAWYSIHRAHIPTIAPPRGKFLLSTFRLNSQAVQYKGSIYRSTCLFISQSLPSCCHPLVCPPSFICHYQTKRM